MITEKTEITETEDAMYTDMIDAYLAEKEYAYDAEDAILHHYF